MCRENKGNGGEGRVNLADSYASSALEVLCIHELELNGGVGLETIFSSDF